MKQITEKDLKYQTDSIDVLNDETLHKKERIWQAITLITCFLAYIFIYFCRNHLYVVNTNFKTYLNSSNEQQAQKYLGIMLAFGYGAYLSGKIFFSLITDTWIKSGAKALMITMILAPITSFLFAIINIDNNESLRIIIVIILWCILRIAQASGWIGIVKIVSNWIPYQYHGRAMSFIALSFLLGDFVTRIILGAVLTYTEKWQHIFMFSSAITMTFAIPTAILVRDNPTSRGLPTQLENPDNVYNGNMCAKTDDNSVESYESNSHNKMETFDIGSNTNEEIKYDYSYSNQTWRVLKPLLNNFDFWLVLIYSFEFSLIREMFNTYSAMYLHENIGIETNVSAWISAAFPLMGLLSAPICGLWVDKIHKKHWRLIILPISAAVICICLSIFSIFDEGLSIYSAGGLLFVCGFSLLGPYSLLAGVMSIDIGGQTSSALVCGAVDSAGYIGAILISLISSFFSFQVMFGVAALVALCAVMTGIVQFKRNYKLSKINVQNDEKRNLI
eukprot:194788_1